MWQTEDLWKRFLRMEQASPDLVSGSLLPDGLHYWPMLRLVFRQAFLKTSSPILYAQHLMRESAVVHTRREIPRRVLGLFRTLPPGSCAYLSPSCFQVQKVRGKAFDPYLDPVAFAAQKQHYVPLKFHLDDGGATPPDTLIPATPIPAIVASQTLQPAGSVGIGPEFAAYVERSLDHGLPVLPMSAVAQYILDVREHASLFQTFLEAARPAMVFLQEYYNAMGQGLALACRRLGIACIEYQHGVQTYPEVAYQFAHVPAQGFETIPEWLFTWGDSDVQRYEAAFAGQAFHKAVAAGKPDYLAWKAGLLADDPERLARLRRMTDGRQVICVPLQGPDYPVHHLERLVASAPEDWVWLLREHPLLPPCAQELAATFPDRVDCVAASGLNLHTVLEHSHHMLFRHSSSVLEAVFLHAMQATTVDSDGLSYFGDCIAAGHIRHAVTPDAILDAIRQGLAAYPYTPEGQVAIIRDEHRLGQLISRLGQQWKHRQ